MPGFSHDFQHGTDSTNIWSAQQTFTTGINLTAGQLIFPATQIASADANTLDDYEEGTFTPTISDSNLDGTGEGQTYSVQNGNYVKFGNRINFNLHLRVTALGTLTTTAPVNITGLPFSSEPNADNFHAATIGQGAQLNLSAGGETVGGYVINNASHVRLIVWDGTSGINNLLISGFSTDGIIMVAGNYGV